MSNKHVFKTKTFDRWAKKVIADAVLCKAAREIELGIYEADLGHGVCKKRVALPGRGKSGSVRSLVAKQHPAAIIFLFGREKSTPGADFSDAVVEVAKTIADNLHRQNAVKLDELVSGGELKEICNGTKKD